MRVTPTTLRPLFRNLGKRISAALPRSEPFLRHVYNLLPSALHDTPENFLRAYFADRKKVRFIQVGAHDGIAGDPIRANVMENSAWSGILLEPNPWVFERLKENYRARTGLQLRCAAVSASSGVLPFYVFHPLADEPCIPSWWTEISSFDRGHLIRNLPEQQHGSITSIDVSVVTLNQLASENGQSDTDLIVMDVEGHEAVILHSIRSEGPRPDVVLFEHKHMEPTLLNQFIEDFGNLGYAAKLYGRDAVFFRDRKTADAAVADRK